MIVKVIIENFQSHKYTVVDLVKGVNVIIGPSDAGKSAIFRAINWPCSNRPLGDSYRSEWGGDTRVTLFTDDEHTIQRYRTDYENGYLLDGTLNLLAGNGEPPKEVMDILKLDSFNIQSQADSPFLLWSSPGEVAQLLNKAASLDDIDRVLNGLRTNLLKINRDLVYTNEQQTALELKMTQYDGMEKLNPMVEELEVLEKEYLSQTEQITRHTKLISRIKRLQQELQGTEKIDELLEQQKETQILYNSYMISLKDYNRRYALLEQAFQLTDDLEESNGVDEAITILAGANGSYAMYQREQAILNRATPLLTRIRELEKMLEKVDMDIENLTTEYNTLAPEICPLCGNQMKKES